MGKKVQTAAECKTYLRPKDVARINDEIADIEKALAAGNDVDRAGSWSHYAPTEVPFNPDELRRRKEILKGTLAREAPQKVAGAPSNKLYREYRASCEELKKLMISKKQQDMFREGRDKGPNFHTPEDFRKAVQACAEKEMSDRGQFLAHRIRELAAQIDPHDPTLRDLERLRPRR